MNQNPVDPVDPLLSQATSEVLAVLDVCKTHLEKSNIVPTADALVSLVEVVLFRASVLGANDA